jgi:hypothetical protein
MDRFLTNLSSEHEKETPNTPTRLLHYITPSQTKVQIMMGRLFHDILLSENPHQINV